MSVWGSGLGLSQVYGFANQSGGATSIDSEIGKGTAITLYLPRTSEGSGAYRLAVAEDLARVPPARVLLVEDDREVADVAVQLLREIGCLVVEARDAKSALALLDRDPTIGLILSDIVMPGGMNGIELARVVRERRPELPILLATGYSQYAPQLMTEEFTLVKKPYHRDRLAASIRAAIEGSPHIEVPSESTPS